MQQLVGKEVVSAIHVRYDIETMVEFWFEGLSRKRAESSLYPLVAKGDLKSPGKASSTRRKSLSREERDRDPDLTGEEGLLAEKLFRARKLFIAPRLLRLAPIFDRECAVVSRYIHFTRRPLRASYVKRLALP